MFKFLKDIQENKKAIKRIEKAVLELAVKVKEAPLTIDDDIMDGVIPMTPEHDERAMKDLLNLKEEEYEENN